MAGGPTDAQASTPGGRPLLAYLLGPVDVPAAEAAFRRLVYDVTGGGPAAVIVCEHPPGISVGRCGSAAHVRLTPGELESRRWPVRWVARGGGVMLHLPGQVACYPVLPLADVRVAGAKCEAVAVGSQPLPDGRGSPGPGDSEPRPSGSGFRHPELTPAEYVAALTDLAADVCRSFQVPAVADHAAPGVRVGRRRVASVGVSVRSGVTTFGLVLNVSPDLEPFRDVDCDGDPVPMTSLQRECPVPVRPQAVRQRLAELVAARFGFDRLSVVHQPPTFHPKPTRHAVTPRPR